MYRRALLPLTLLAGCHRTVELPAPPRVETAAALPNETSTVVVPLSASLADLTRALETQVPRRLWAIDQRLPRCVAGRRIGRLKVTPDLGCRVRGQVTRGPLRLGGQGDRLTIALPVHATIAAEKVGGVVSKTATGDATVHAVARLTLGPRWTPAARVAIAYDWTTPPGIDLFGQRISFVEKADERLKPVVARLEQTLPRELAKLDLRRHLDAAWRRGFTVVQLNGANPPAWMRVTPRRLGFGGYRIGGGERGGRLELLLAADALTETFVGPRPADPKPTQLPPRSRIADRPGLRFYVPVLADYRQLEPVVRRALDKRAAAGITLTGIGPVEARFGAVTVYATTGGRLAVGVEADVRQRGSSVVRTRGRLWLTATPWNAPDSRLIAARDVQLVADTDSRIANLLVALGNDTGVHDSIAAGLRHDFTPDYGRVLAAARRAVGHRQEGDFLLNVDITDVRTGAIQATGRGLFLPVRATGAATISFRPR